MADGGVLQKYLGQGVVDDLSSAARQQFIREVAEVPTHLRDAYQLYLKYYEGEQEAFLNDRQREYLELCGLPFNENFCETIVDQMAERMQITGFQVPDLPEAEDYLRDIIWPTTGLAELQGTVHTMVPVKGDGYLVADVSSAGRPRLCYNRPEIVHAVYSDEDDNIEFAVKKWNSSRRSITNPQGQRITRLNIYFHDRVEKWYTNASAADEKSAERDWLPHIDPEDITVSSEDEETTAAWPTWWTTTGTPEGEPLGVNCFHFRNKPKGGTHGRSELRGVIPQQDALTKQCLDMLAVMDTQGWKQRWASGVQTSDSLSVAIGEWVKTSSENAKFGEFDAEDPRPMLEAIEGQLRRMAARSQTPLFAMMSGGTMPTGESQKMAFAPLVGKVMDRQPGYGRVWSDAARMVLKLGALFDEKCPLTIEQVPDDLVIKPTWDDPEPRNDATEAAVALDLHALGVSKKTLLDRLGFDADAEAKQMAKEAKEALKLAPPPPDNVPVPIGVLDPEAVPPPAEGSANPPG